MQHTKLSKTNTVCDPFAKYLFHGQGNISIVSGLVRVYKTMGKLVANSHYSWRIFVHSKFYLRNNMISNNTNQNKRHGFHNRHLYKFIKPSILLVKILKVYNFIFGFAVHRGFEL